MNKTLNIVPVEFKEGTPHTILANYKEYFDLNDKQPGFSSMLFFTEDQIKKVREIYIKFIEKLNIIEREAIDPKTEKPYYVFTFGMPLKLVIEELSSSS